MENAKAKAHNQIWRDLPLELLSSVMANLEIEDNVRASAVCKSWYAAAVSVRIIEQSPWLMYLKTYNTYEFFDPSDCKTYTMELPKSLDGSTYVHDSKDGWLLMSKRGSSHFVLFNPFTQDLVVLPYLHLKSNRYQLVGFSCAPTSSDCVVFTTIGDDPGHVTIRTWSPGQTMWTYTQVQSRFLNAEYNKVVFWNGLIFCFNESNGLTVFDPSLRTWNDLDVPPIYRPYGIDPFPWFEGKFIVEYKDDIYLICSYGSKDPLVFKLDLTWLIWEKVDTLGSLTIFVSGNSCVSRTYVKQGRFRNSIYFPTVCDNEKSLVAYSFDEGSYHPREHGLNWEDDRYFDNIWIEAPKNAFQQV